MRQKFLSLIPFLIMLTVSHSVADEMADAYQRAVQLVPSNVNSLTKNTAVRPMWIGETESFVYKRETEEGHTYIFVNPEKKIKRVAFDHARLAKVISDANGPKFSKNELKLNALKFTENHIMQFKHGGDSWQCDTTIYKCEKKENNKSEHVKGSVVSPDKSMSVYLDNHNLHLHDIKTGEIKQLTFDGLEDFDYRLHMDHPEIGADKPIVSGPSVIWSPDSKYIVIFKIDFRNVGMNTIIQSSPQSQVRPLQYSLPHFTASDANYPYALVYRIEVETGKVSHLDLPPLPLTDHSFPNGGNRMKARWVDNEHVWIPHAEGGFKKISLYEVNIATKATRKIYSETATTHFPHLVRTIKPINKGKSLLWHSERDGWSHFYLIDAKTGGVVRQVTKGKWQTHNIRYFDERKQRLYFSATGMKKGKNPYHWNIYSVDLKGSKPKLLTPEDADHFVKLSKAKTKRYFVDTFSDIDKAPSSVVRRLSDGKLIMQLEDADINPIKRLGWSPPEEFVAKGRDKKTDIYGVIVRPSNFDSSKRYPVIEYVYNAPYSRMGYYFGWGAISRLHSMAELGFIVVMVDGMGADFRSHDFRAVQYKNVGDAGLPDRLLWIKEETKKYPYMDLNRVGIMGNSHGGFTSMRSILMEPDFYKVAVVGEGIHDWYYDRSFNARFLLGEVGDHYKEQSNITHAQQLKAKLLLVHGELDEPVPVAQTLKMADALIKANKDFDMLIIPNQGHYLRNNNYFIRKRWDYFVRHLLDKQPTSREKVSLLQ